MNTSSADLTVTLPRKRTGAAVLFSAPDGRALLLEPAYKDFWEIPGGVVEMNESPHDAATREIQEKLGLSVRVGRLLVVDWEPPRTDRTEGIMFIYAGGSLDPLQENDIRLDPAEMRSWCWSTRSEINTRLPKILARRVTTAMLALTEGTTPYLEDGSFVS